MNTPEESQWNDLQRLIGTRTHNPPTAYLLSVFALVPDPAKIVGAITTLESRDESTVWKSWISTDTAVAHLSAEYDVDHYDRASEDDQFYRHNPPEVSLAEAWVRPLAELVRVDFASLGPRPTPRDGFFLLGAATLTFSDGGSVEVPGHPNSYDPLAREQVDAFHAGIRSQF